MNGGATFSGDQRYRYTLTRTFREAPPPPVIFIMLNPSTATAEKDDPTIRRCISFADRHKFGGLVVLNLFGLRATDPEELYVADDPVGPFNDAAIMGVLAQYAPTLVIAAWGEHGVFQDRSKKVMAMIKGYPLHALRVNKSGQPGHPLYLPKSLEPHPYL